MFRFCAALILLSLSTAISVARMGYVQTRDGKVFEGHVRFESNAVVVVNAEKEVWAEVVLTNLAGVTFVPEPSAPTWDGFEMVQTELPTPWVNEDVGSVSHAGSVAHRTGVFRVRSSGTNVLGTEDSCHFVFKPASGTSEVIARVTKVQLTDPWARAGLMMRESLAAGSRNVFLSVTAARGGVFQWRERLGEETSVTLDRSFGGPCWLKLKREGSTFTALRSRNGVQWAPVDRVTMSATKDLYVGMAVVSAHGGVLNESVFEGVEEGSALRNRWFTPQVELQSGSLQLGYIETMDDTAVHFEGRFGRESVSRGGVANIRFQPLPSKVSASLNAGRPGVLLTSGEFIEGECRGLSVGRVAISSVPLGLVRYDVNSEVVAVVLRKRSLSAAHLYEMKLVNGSVWRGLEVALDPRGVTIREPTLGLRRIPMHEVAEFRRRS
jgi:hypothetical protein